MILLGANRYGQAEVRLARVARDTERHEIEDLSITSQLRGDIEAAHTAGDNSPVVATDTQKNTVYAFARGARRRSSRGSRGTATPRWPRLPTTSSPPR